MTVTVKSLNPFWKQRRLKPFNASPHFLIFPHSRSSFRVSCHYGFWPNYFVGVCLLKILPVIHLPQWAILWIVLIAAMKALNLWFSHAYHRNKLFYILLQIKIQVLCFFLHHLYLYGLRLTMYYLLYVQ